MWRRRDCLRVALGLLALLPIGTVALAGQPVAQEDRIRDAMTRVDRAGTAIGEAESLERLSAAFRVRPRVVMDLRDQKLDYGEVAVVLALSEAGKTSVDAVLGLWATDRLNWGQIADRLKVDLRDLLRRLEGVRRDLARRNR
jgi:hypothetical protein